MDEIIQLKSKWFLGDPMKHKDMIVFKTTDSKIICSDGGADYFYKWCFFNILTYNFAFEIHQSDTIELLSGKIIKPYVYLEMDKTGLYFIHKNLCKEIPESCKEYLITFDADNLVQKAFAWLSMHRKKDGESRFRVFKKCRNTEEQLASLFYKTDVYIIKKYYNEIKSDFGERIAQAAYELRSEYYGYFDEKYRPTLMKHKEDELLRNIHLYYIEEELGSESHRKPGDYQYLDKLRDVYRLLIS